MQMHTRSPPQANEIMNFLIRQCKLLSERNIFELNFCKSLSSITRTNDNENDDDGD